jgi:hypothetical protein
MRILFSLQRSSLRDDSSAFFTGAGTDFNQLIRVHQNSRIVVNQNDRVFAINQLPNNLHQAIHIVWMKSD